MNKFGDYVALIELRPLENCAILDPEELAGAAVRCFISAETCADAVRRLLQTLEDESFELVQIEWCCEHSSVEWEKPNDEGAQELIELARATGEVEFAEFHAWGYDAPDL